MIRPKYFRVESEDGVQVLHFVDADAFEHVNLAEMADELIDFLEAQRPQRLLVNFAGVTRCPTEFIAGVLSTQDRVRSYGGSLKLFGLDGHVRDVFRTAKLDGKVLAIYDTAEEALAEFSRGTR